METLGIDALVKAAGEAGVVMFSLAMGAYFLMALIRMNRGLSVSSNDRWDDLIKLLQDQLQVQRESTAGMTAFRDTIHDEFDEVHKDLNAKVERLEGKVDTLSDEVRKVLLLIGEEKASG